MRDRTKAAAAILRSEAYREAYRDGEAPPVGEVPPRPRGGNGASASRPRVGSRASSPLTALALLGLLDLLKGG